MIFAAYALVVGILFWIVFKDKEKKAVSAEKDLSMAEDVDAGGFTSEI